MLGRFTTKVLVVLFSTLSLSVICHIPVFSLKHPVSIDFSVNLNICGGDVVDVDFLFIIYQHIPFLCKIYCAQYNTPSYFGTRSTSFEYPRTS